MITTNRRSDSGSKRRLLSQRKRWGQGTLLASGRVARRVLTLFGFSLNASQRRGCTGVEFTLERSDGGAPPLVCKGGDFDLAFPCRVACDRSPESIWRIAPGPPPKLFQSKQPSVPAAFSIPHGNSFPARTAEPSLCVTNWLLIQMPRGNVK
jgi:hypothetical protein